MAKEKITLYVDNEPYEWDDNKITGAQLRQLAGIPENALIYRKVRGKPDELIKNDTVVNLKQHEGPPKFSTQAPGSQAG